MRPIRQLTAGPHFERWSRYGNLWIPTAAYETRETRMAWAAIVHGWIA
jgi:hypothetical protein